MSEEFKPIDFSKYAELRDLWNMHPQNTQGIAGQISPEQVSSSYKRFNELSQQLSDEVGGGDRATEAMIALGAVNLEDLDITSGATNYEEIMNRRKEFLAQGRSVEEADAIEPFRLAAILTGERQPDLDYVQADRARHYYSQYGTPEQIDYTNQLATQLRSAQPQGMMSLPSLTGLLNTSSAQMPISSKFFNTSLSNPLQTYLQTLEAPYYIDLVRRLSRKQ
jgi:hypothetical protein